MTTKLRTTIMAAFPSLRDAQQLLDRGVALHDDPHAVLLQEHHAVLDRLMADGVDVGALLHHLADPVVDDQQLEDAGPPAVARAAAELALPVLAVSVLRLRRAVEGLDAPGGEV